MDAQQNRKSVIPQDIAGASEVHAEDCSFETPRLRVVDWHSLSSVPEGGSRLLEIVRDFLTPRVTGQLPEAWQGPYSKQRATDWIRDRDAEGTQLLAISQESHEPIGLLLLHETTSASPGPPELRLGYLIAESEWGKGYASELVRGLIDWARGRSFGSIIAGVSAENLPSVRVLEKCGFSRDDDDSPRGTELFYGIDL